MRSRTQCRYSFIGWGVCIAFISMAVMSPISIAGPTKVSPALSFSDKVADPAAVQVAEAVGRNLIASFAMLQISPEFTDQNSKGDHDVYDNEQSEAALEKIAKEKAASTASRKNSVRPPPGRISWREIVNWQELHEQALKKRTAR